MIVEQEHVIPEEEMETVYLYVYDEDPEHRWKQIRDWLKQHWHTLLMQVLALGMLSGFCLVPGTPIYTLQTLTLPARLLPVQVYQATVKIEATGTKTLPATPARGMLTIYNGSFLTEQLPAGFIVTTRAGVEIATDSPVAIPPENPPLNGIATVAAHAVQPGSAGNIPAVAVNAVVGSSLYLKNLAAFAGGQDARTLHYVTSADRAAALAMARVQVSREQARAKRPGLLQESCAETDRQAAAAITVQLACQYVRYSTPRGVQVLAVRLYGRTVVLQVRTLVLPR